MHLCGLFLPNFFSHDGTFRGKRALSVASPRTDWTTNVGSFFLKKNNWERKSLSRIPRLRVFRFVFLILSSGISLMPYFSLNSAGSTESFKDCLLLFLCRFLSQQKYATAPGAPSEYLLF